MNKATAYNILTSVKQKYSRPFRQGFTAEEIWKATGRAISIGSVRELLRAMDKKGWADVDKSHTPYQFYFKRPLDVGVEIEELKGFSTATASRMLGYHKPRAKDTSDDDKDDKEREKRETKKEKRKVGGDRKAKSKLSSFALVLWKNEEISDEDFLDLLKAIKQV